MNHLKKHWIIYVYVVLQITLATLDYKKIINWKWIYVWMPSLIMGTILLLLIILAILKEDYENNIR
jgi:hypothetical protein